MNVHLLNDTFAMIARKGVVKIENNGRKSIKAFWTVLSTVLFSLSAVLLPLLTLLKCPFWIVNLVFFQFAIRIALFGL